MVDMEVWLGFVRKYCPVSSNDAMYDELHVKEAQAKNITPPEFEHPALQDIEVHLEASPPKSIVLTGTAGEGKTHLCRKIWNKLGGKPDVFIEDGDYLLLEKAEHHSVRKFHFVKDLSAWAPQAGVDWPPDKRTLMLKFVESCFGESNLGEASQELFIIAANDGQLLQTLNRLSKDSFVENEGGAGAVAQARKHVERFLSDGQDGNERLYFLNMSRHRSADLFKKVLDAFIDHPAWKDCERQSKERSDGLFSERCSIRQNYKLLKKKRVRSRLEELMVLAEASGYHLPVRQIFSLLANALLGHRKAKDGVLGLEKDKNKQLGLDGGSLYSNLFGENLRCSDAGIDSVFQVFSSFQIGYETSNSFDHLLIYDDGSEEFKNYVVADPYGSDSAFHKAREEYNQAHNEDPADDSNLKFSQMLVEQRRGLFFRLPSDAHQDFNPWGLSIFKFAGDFLELKRCQRTRSKALRRIVRGLNRTFCGMLVEQSDTLWIAAAPMSSQGAVSRIYCADISNEPRKGESIQFRFGESDSGAKVFLSVKTNWSKPLEFELTLLRFEFLSRIGETGALPRNFSRECYHDALAFKTEILNKCQDQLEEGSIRLKVLGLGSAGEVRPKTIEVLT